MHNTTDRAKAAERMNDIWQDPTIRTADDLAASVEGLVFLDGFARPFAPADKV